jgi:hypothetical protein
MYGKKNLNTKQTGLIALQSSITARWKVPKDVSMDRNVNNRVKKFKKIIEFNTSWFKRRLKKVYSV